MHVPYNDQFFKGQDGHDYVVCARDNFSWKEDVCPITSVAFFISQSSLYEKVDENFYISREVTQHGIEQVRIMPNQPCFHRIEYNADSE